MKLTEVAAAPKQHLLKGGFILQPMFHDKDVMEPTARLGFRVDRLMDAGHGELWVSRSFGHYKWFMYFNGEEMDLPTVTTVQSSKEKAHDFPELFKWAEKQLMDERLWTRKKEGRSFGE